jgi:cation:H+ antiporter
MTLIWILVFIIALIAIIKGADWLLGSAERIGLALGMSPFVVGVLIVGIGTSFPELVSGLFAAFNGVPEFVVANAFGSNIANVLLVVGASAIVARHLVVTKNLIDEDLPLLVISTVVVLGVVWDRSVVFAEAIILLGVYAVYLWYIFSSGEKESLEEVLPSRMERRGLKKFLVGSIEAISIPKNITIKDVSLLVVGVTFLFFGAKYLIDSVVALSSIFNIAPSAIAIFAVAVGTSLPELVVSIKAAMQKKSEVALGNILGSNVFNILGVIAIPALFMTLPVDDLTFSMAVPVLAMSTLIFVFSGISKKIHMWEGAMYLILYILFIGKLFALF